MDEQVESEFLCKQPESRAGALIHYIHYRFEFCALQTIFRLAFNYSEVTFLHL